MNATRSLPRFPHLPQPAVALSTVATSDPVQNSGFAILWVYVFFLFSRFSEVIDAAGPTHVVFVLAILTGMASLATGGVLKAFASRAGFWLTLFTMWLAIEIPFSSWRGGSFEGFVDAWLKSFATFLMAAALISTMAHCRKLMYSLAFGAVFVVALTALKGAESTEDSRLAVGQGTLGNSNDLASQLLMGLPFCLYVAFDSKRVVAVRVAFMAVSAALLLLVFKTGSRGSLVAIGVLCLFVFLKASMANKAKLLAALVLFAVVVPFAVPKDIRDRYMTTLWGTQIKGGSTDQMASAVLSSETRKQLLVRSIELTAKHPIFGVGLGQFAAASFSLSWDRGELTVWREAHNFLTLLSSETGLPALFFYLAVMFVCIRDLLGIMRATRGQPALADVARIAFCMVSAWTAFIVCNLFSTNAYTFHMPLLAGITTAFVRAASIEADAAKAGAATQPKPLASPLRPFPLRPKNRIPA